MRCWLSSRHKATRFIFTRIQKVRILLCLHWWRQLVFLLQAGTALLFSQSPVRDNTTCSLLKWLPAWQGHECLQQCKQLLHELDLPLLGEHHSLKKGQAESHKKAKYIYVVCVLLVSLFVVNDLRPSHAFPRFHQLFPNHFTAALTDSPHNTQRQRGKHTFSKGVPLPNA